MGLRTALPPLLLLLLLLLLVLELEMEEGEEEVEEEEEGEERARSRARRRLARRCSRLRRRGFLTGEDGEEEVMMVVEEEEDDEDKEEGGMEAYLVRVEEEDDEKRVQERATTPTMLNNVPTSASRAGLVQDGANAIPLSPPPPRHKTAAASTLPLPLLLLLLIIVTTFLHHGPSTSLTVPCRTNPPNTTSVAPTKPPTNSGMASPFLLKPNRRCVHSIRREATGANTTAPATRNGLVTCDPAHAIATTLRKRRNVACRLASPPTLIVSADAREEEAAVVMVPPLVCHQAMDTAKVYQREFKMP